MKIIVLFLILGVIGALWAAAIEAMAPPEFKPMSPDEEREMLKEHNLTDAEIDEIMK